MADSSVRLNLIMGMVDKITGPIQKVTTQTTKAGEQIKKTEAELKRLGGLSKDVDHFRKLKNESQQTGQALEQAQRKVSRLAAEMKASEKPTRKMTRDFKAAQAEAAKLKTRHEEQTGQLQKMRGNLQQAGVSTKNLNEATRKIRSETEKYNAQLKAQQKHLDDVAERQNRMAKISERNSEMRTGALTDSVGVGAAVFGAKQLVDAYGEIGSAQGEIGSLGISSEGIEKITKAAKEFSNEWAGTTTTDFIKASYDIKSGIASLSDEAVAEFTKIAALTATGTKSSTAEMTSLFATGYGIYRKQFNQFAAATIDGWEQLSEQERDMKFGEYFSSGISNSVRQFKTDGSQMSAALSNLGATATAANVPFSEQLSILGQLQSTMSGSEAATKYRAFLGAAAGAGEKLGLTFTDANDQLMSMPEILNQLRDKYGETIDAVEAQDLKKAFGTDEAVGLIQLLYPEIDTLNNNISAMDENLKGGMKTTNEMAGSIGKGTAESFAILSQRIFNMSANIGALFAPAMITVVDLIGKGAMVLGEFTEKFPFLSQVLAYVVVGILAFKVASIAGRLAFSYYSDAILFGQKALTFLSGAQVKNTALMVASRVKTLAAAGASAVMAGAHKAQAIATALTTSATLRANAAMALSRVRSLAMVSALVLMSGTQKALAAGTAIMTGAQWALNAAMLANPIGLVIAGVMALIAVVALVVKYWEPLCAFFSGLWDRIKVAFSIGWEFIKKVFMWSPIGLVMQSWGALTTFFSGMWSGIKSGLSKAWEFIKAVFMWSPLGLIMQAWEPLTNFFSGLWDGIKGMFGGALDWIKSVVLAPIEAIKNTLGAAWDALFGSDDDVEVSAKVKQVADQVPAATNPAAVATTPTGEPVATVPGKRGDPVVAQSSKASVAPVFQYGDIIIQAAPGMDAEAIAREVRRQLDERDRQAATKYRGRLYD
ncbi:TPA: phage tail tape measure protein [Vibrio parahaemolyticus]|nr:phage tail tape measure protein [Vibrio parahaemolyticus]